MAWTLGAPAVAAALASVSLKAHSALVAETCARSFAPLPRTSRIAANIGASGFPDARRARRRARRDVSAFLVVDMFLVCAVALRTADVGGAVAFADPGVAAALAYAWPAAIANWIARLASETRWRVFDDVAVAVARKETTAMRRATRARRLGGLPAPKLPPPDAKRWRRIRYALALVAGQWREAATCGSARAFRRVIAACCVFDWLTIASVWSGLGVVSAVANGTLAHVSNVSASALAPLATFLFLDAARVAAQLVHARLLVDARVSSDARVAAKGSPPAGSDDTECSDARRNTKKNVSSRAGRPLRAFGRALPAGMVARLTRATYALNVWNLALVVVAGVFLGGVPGGTIPPVSMSTTAAPAASSASSFLVVARVVATARFARLVAETAYLAAALLAVVDRPRIVAESDAGEARGTSAFPLASLRLDLRHLGVDGDLSSAVAERVAAARALAARLGAGLATMTPNASPGDLGSPGDRSLSAFASAPAMTLAEFTEAIAPGLRGYLVGARAEAAAAKVFREICASGSDGQKSASPADGVAAGPFPMDSVGLADIQRWLAAQPSLCGPDGGGSAGSGGSAAGAAPNAVSEVEKEIQWRRSVQRVLLRLARRAEYGRRRRGGGEARGGEKAENGNAPRGADALAVPAEPSAAPEKPRGLRLLSLEGGGIKGLALIWQLRALERAAGRPIHELFDLIGGVSTGGIIALGLARGVPLRELEKMYHDIGRDVFGSQSAVRRLLKGNAADNTAIRDLLLEYLGDLPMLDAPGQLARCFVVATQQTERLEVRLLRTYRHPNKGRDQNEGWRQWEAGMATSSAPTVFPPFVREIRGDENASGVATSSAADNDAMETGAETDAETGAAETAKTAPAAKNPTRATLRFRAGRVSRSAPPRQVFIDGALSGYNNPSSLVLNEGLDLAEQGQQIDVLLSLGCGEVAGAAGAESENGDRGLVFWLGQVVNLAFDVELQEAHVASLIQRFSPQTMHVRLNPPTGGVSLTEHRPEILHRMEQDTRQYLAENRVVFADVAAALVENRGFARVDAAPSTPWDAPGIEDVFWDATADPADDARGAGAILGASAASASAARASGDAEKRDSKNASGANGVFSASVSDADAAGGGSLGPSGLSTGAFESIARERDRERVTRRDAKGASVTVRRGSGASGGDAEKSRRKKITASAPVAPLDRFPSFPGPGTARSAEAARRRADAAKAFADTSNVRNGWRRFFWGAGVKAARGAVDEDVGEVAEVQPVREQVALGEVPDVDTKARGAKEAKPTKLEPRKGAESAAVGAEAAGETRRGRSVSAKSWLDEGAELVSGWDDDKWDDDAYDAKEASDAASETTKILRKPRGSCAKPKSADVESDVGSDAR